MAADVVHTNTKRLISDLIPSCCLSPQFVNGEHPHGVTGRVISSPQTHALCIVVKFVGVFALPPIKAQSRN